MEAKVGKNELLDSKAIIEQTIHFLKISINNYLFIHTSTEYASGQISITINNPFQVVPLRAEAP